MAFLFPYLLFLHVAGAILAFGPTYAYGFYSSLAEREPMHRSFDALARAEVTRRLTVPATLSMFVTGALLIAVVGYPWLAPSSRWLQLGIALYIGAIDYNVLITRPMGARVEKMGRQLAAQRAGSASSGPPPGPSPEVATLIHRLQRDGKAMGVLVMVIVFLMVVKPSSPF